MTGKITVVDHRKPRGQIRDEAVLMSEPRGSFWRVCPDAKFLFEHALEDFPCQIRGKFKTLNRTVAHETVLRLRENFLKTRECTRKLRETERGPVHNEIACESASSRNLYEALPRSTTSTRFSSADSSSASCISATRPGGSGVPSPRSSPRSISEPNPASPRACDPKTTTFTPAAPATECTTRAIISFSFRPISMLFTVTQKSYHTHTLWCGVEV